jgi:hypothetical protein
VLVEKVKRAPDSVAPLDPLARSVLVGKHNGMCGAVVKDADVDSPQIGTRVASGSRGPPNASPSSTVVADLVVAALVVAALLLAPMPGSR